MKESGIYIGDNPVGKPLFLSEADRARSIHMIGMPESGKTKLMEQMIKEDILAGNGLCLFDIQANLYRDLLKWIVERRMLNQPPEKSKIILINPLEIEDWSVGFNPLDPGPVKNYRDISAFAHGVMDTVLSVNDRRENVERPPLITRVLSAVFYTAIEKQMTLVEARHLLSANDPHLIREFCTQSSGNDITQSEWEEFNALRPHDRVQWFMGPFNRLKELIDSESMQCMFSQSEQPLDWLKIMDEGYVVLINLGYDEVSWSHKNSQLLGRLILHSLTTRARFRVRKGDQHPRPFYIYIDEFYEYLTADLAHGLEALRQFGLRFILSHQFLNQLERVSKDISGAIMALPGARICFQIDPDDMELMAKRMFLQDINLEEEKLSLRTTYVVGHERQHFTGGSHSEGHSHTESNSSGSATSSSTSEGSGEMESSSADGDSTSSGVSSFESAGSTTIETSSHTSSDAYSSSSTSSWAEQLVPILEEKVGGVFTLEEQFFKRGRVLSLLPPRQFVMYRHKHGVDVGRTPDIIAALPSDKRSLEKQVAYHEKCPFAMKKTDVRALIKKREGDLRALARGLGSDRDPEYLQIEDSLVAAYENDETVE